MSDKPVKRRSEKEGVFRFGREMISALAMALVFIFYVIQAFKIPSGSMEDSLLVGDFLLGLKFIYGAPVLPGLYQRFPAVTRPKPGDVIIFKYPGSEKKDFIKRCIAGPGQTIETKGKQLMVDGRELVLPPKGKFVANGQLGNLDITNFAPLRIPAKGDVIKTDSLPVREFVFLDHLIHQENPHAKVRMELQLYLNGEFSNATAIANPYGSSITFADLNTRPVFPSRMTGYRLVTLNGLDYWTDVEMNLQEIERLVATTFPDKKVDIRRVLYLDEKPVKQYTVKLDNFFMMGDNRDNSADSRYWGYLNYNFVKAKAFILYFSLDKEVPYYLLPMKIRWNRIGKLIRAVDLLPKK